MKQLHEKARNDRHKNIIKTQKNLPNLLVGEKVIIQEPTSKQWKLQPFTVESKVPHKDSYILRSPTCAIIRRHQKHIKCYITPNTEIRTKLQKTVRFASKELDLDNSFPTDSDSTGIEYSGSQTPTTELQLQSLHRRLFTRQAARLAAKGR